jgi:ribonuclease P protein component
MPVHDLSPIKGKKNFERLFRTGKRFFQDSASAIVVFKAIQERNELSGNDSDGTSLESQAVRIALKLNYAVVVSKKTAKKAVVRNRIKRLMRESIRVVAHESAFLNALSSIDSIVLMWRHAPKMPSQIGLNYVLPQVQALFASIHKYVSSLKN